MNFDQDQTDNLIEQKYIESYKDLLKEKCLCEQEKYYVTQKLSLLSKMYSAALDGYREICQDYQECKGNLQSFPLILQDMSADKEKQMFFLEKIIDRQRKQIEASEKAYHKKSEITDRTAYAARETLSRIFQNYQKRWKEAGRYFSILRKFAYFLGKVTGKRNVIVSYECFLIRLSSFFDEEWYKAHYFHGMECPMNPVEHYLKYGWKENKDPSQFFSTEKYLSVYGEVEGNPLVHYLEYGYKQKYQPFMSELKEISDYNLIKSSVFFDSQWYLKQYPHVSEEGGDPAAHYITIGWIENYDPSPYFSTEYYLKNYPDVKGNPLLHYLRVGRSKGCKVQEKDVLHAGIPLYIEGFFDPVWYRSIAGDISGYEEWMHFVLKGWAAGLTPAADFSMTFWKEKYPELKDGENPLVHHILYGKTPELIKNVKDLSDYELVERSKLFDSEWYLRQYPDIAASKMDPVEHYLIQGYLENRNPSPFFDTASYKAVNKDLSNEYNPLVHYLRFGMTEGRQIFKSSMLEPIENRIARTSGLFDEKWYRKNNSDIPSNVDVLNHFMTQGWLEGREPSANFSLSLYNNLNLDIKFSLVHPMHHFINQGFLENRKYGEKISFLDQHQLYQQLSIIPVLYDEKSSNTAAVLNISSRHTTAVHLHLCYTEMAEYFVKYLRMLPEKFDLFVSLPLSDKTEQYRDYFKKELPLVEKVEVVQTPNRGRDIAPFIVTFGKKLMKYDRICHLHTKRSPHAPQLANWLDYIMEHLFGSTEQIKYIFSLLDQNDRIVFPPAYRNLDYDDTGWGRNLQLVKEFSEKYPCLNIKSLPKYIDFVHGSMLWARGSAMEGFLDLPLTYEDFPAEPIDSDATLAHVMERLTLLLTSVNGGNADKIFLKRDFDDYAKYQIMYEDQKKYAPVFKESESSLKIVLVSHDSDRSGAPILALNMAAALKKIGYQLFIILLKKGDLYSEFEQYGTVQLFDADSLEKLKAILPVLKETGYKNVLLNTVLSGALASMFQSEGFTAVTLIHEMGYSIEKYEWQFMAKQAIACSEKIVMPSSVVADSWRSIGLDVPENQLIINPQGDYWNDRERTVWDKEDARKYICETLHLPKDARIVLSAALVEKRKGIDAFAETAEKFSGKGQKVYFVWVGATPERMADISELSEKIEKLDNCIFTEFKKDLDRYIAGSDVFFLPSLADPFPAVSLLSANQGTPIVLCDGYAGSSDFCKNFSAGLVKEYSADAFAHEISRIISDRELHKRVSDECVEFSRNFHSFRQYMIELLSLFPDGLKKVSCIVPNYQYEKYLPERLDSILQQDYPIYDIVFLDDCSTDNSLCIAEKILKESQIDYQILANKQNSGSVFKQWFKGIEAARGDFIWIAEADDACASTFLRKVILPFHNETVNLSYAQSCLIDGDSKVYNNNFKTHTDSISALKWSDSYINTLERELNEGLSVKNTIPNASAIVIRKSAVNQINKEFLFQFKVAGDWVFYLELLKNGSLAFTSEVLNFYRRHSTSVVHKNMDRNCQEFEMIHKYILDNFTINNRMILFMKDEFDRFYEGFKPSFKRTLDYKACLKSGEKELLMFITDDIKNSCLASAEVLKKYCGKYELWLIDAGIKNQSLEDLEKLPLEVTYCRFADIIAGKRPNKEKIIIATDFKDRKIAADAKSLKYFISGNDVLLMDDCSGGVDSKKGSLLDAIEKHLK